MRRFGFDKMLTTQKGLRLITKDLEPTRKHQAEEELMNLQKEFAEEIYFNRDREGAFRP